MDCSATASRYRGPLRARAPIADRAFGICDHAFGAYDSRHIDARRSDMGASPQASLRRQHAALADMVRAVEPDFANELAGHLLAQYGSLTAVLSEPLDGLTTATGNAMLAAVISSAKSVVVESLLAELPKAPFSAANQSVVRYVTAILGGLTHEEAHAFFLDGRLGFLRHEVFSYGAEDRAAFPVQMIFRRAVQIGSSQIVLIHNHPSGSPEPSEMDKDVTSKIAAAGRAIGISIHDHLVVAGPHMFSFRAAGLL